MKNRLMALFAALLISGACYVLLAALIDRGWPFEDVLLAAIAATLTLAALAALLGYRAWRRSFEIRTEFRHLAASVDAAFRDLAGRPAETFNLSDLDAHIAREVARLADRLRTENGAAQPAEFDGGMRGGNIVPHPAARRSRREINVEAPAESRAAEAQAVHRAIAGGSIELSLQPIISIAQGAAAGFEVHAHLELGDGRSVDLRRVTDLVRASEQAAFERLMVQSAAQAARRRLGDAGESMPMHVAISGSLIEQDAELSVVLELFRQYPTLSRSLVLSLPAELLESGGAGLQRLSSAGVSLAAEGPAGREEALRQGVSFVKLPASTLLEPAKSEKASRRIEELLEACETAAIGIIATDVSNDEEAVGLIDLGVHLMSGLRFSGPKQLRTTNAAGSGRLAAVQEPPPATSAG